MNNCFEKKVRKGIPCDLSFGTACHSVADLSDWVGVDIALIPSRARCIINPPRGAHARKIMPRILSAHLPLSVLARLSFRA